MINKKLIINIGLIGAGDWGVKYIKTINKLPHMNLKVVCTSRNEIKKYLSEDCLLISDVNLINKDHNLDGIIIAVPPSIQVSLAIKFFETGIPLLLEKPICTSLEDAKILIQANKINKSSILVNNIFLYSEAFKVFRNQIKNKKSILKFNSFDGNKGPYRKYINSYWDWGSHSLSLCLKLMGNPISGNLKKLDVNNKDAQNYELNLNFKNNRNAKLIFGNDMKTKIRYFELAFVGQHEKLIFNDVSTHKVFKKINNDIIEKYEYKQTDALVSVLNRFYTNITEKQCNLRSLELNYYITYILESLLQKNIFKFDFLKTRKTYKSYLN